ncbi:MAG: ImmA/IrrE family metallo-endopeptidase [Vampirovibrionales bacterium]
MSKTPFLSKPAIESKALELIETHYQKEIKSIQGFIDIDSIVEKTLGYELTFKDLSIMFNAPNILGYINGDERVVYIDGALAEDSKQEGRCRYTIAHEIGHAVIHIPKPSDAIQLNLLEMDKPMSIFCREQDIKIKMTETYDRIEYQANYFASCLLMPRYPILEAIKPFYGSKGIQRYAFNMTEAVPVLAKQFRVSNQAMKYRLEEFQHYGEELMFL